VPPPTEGQAYSKALEALRQKMSDLQAQEITQPEPPSTAQAEENAIIARTEARKEAEQAADTQAKARQAQAAAGFKPLEAPASPISASKEARLAELLTQYKADQITPEQYHTQRAKILAEP
jgi:FKBP-type peptidyl-prolyl cis-trans isomerase (trigger factor)